MTLDELITSLELLAEDNIDRKLACDEAAHLLLEYINNVSVTIAFTRIWHKPTWAHE